MNKNMRLQYCAFLFPFLLCACEQGGDELSPSSGNSAQVTVKAQVVDTNTRTYMSSQDDQTYHVLWSQGEQIVIGQTGNFSVLSLTSGDGTTVAQFTGDEPSAVYGSLYASVYPTTNAFAGVDGDFIYAGNLVPASQTYVPETFAKNQAPMAAVSDDGLLYQFHNLYGIIQLPIYGKGTIRQIELFGNAGEDVAGQIGMLYAKTDGKPAASATESDNGFMLRKGTSLQDRITLTFGEDGLALSETDPTVVNVVVLPGTFTDGFTLHIYDMANDEVFEKICTQELTLRRSWVKRMVAFDYSSIGPILFEPDVNPWIPEPDSDLVE